MATWNLNSLRVRLPAVERFLDRVRPDVLCLQETRAGALSADAAAAFERLGYAVAYVGSGPAGGVAIAARWPIADVRGSGDLGLEQLDREARLVSCIVDGPTPLRVASVYAPHGRSLDHWHYDYKLAFFAELTEIAAQWREADGRLIVAGDLNIAPTDSDVFHPDAFVGSTHVSRPERDALSALTATGMLDIDAVVWGADARRFTWWNYGIGYSRNLGMRIDLLLADEALAARIDTTWIDHTERGVERPSDHAALIADFHHHPP